MSRSHAHRGQPASALALLTFLLGGVGAAATASAATATCGGGEGAPAACSEAVSAEEAPLTLLQHSTAQLAPHGKALASKGHATATQKEHTEMTPGHQDRAVARHAHGEAARAGPGQSKASPGAGHNRSASESAWPWADTQPISKISSDYPTMTNVYEAFNNISENGVVFRLNKGPHFPEGFNKGYMPYSEHFQGVQRQRDSNYIYLSASHHDAGYLFVGHGESLPTTGAMGTNMYTPDGGELSYPPHGDTIVKVEEVDFDNTHAGGLSSFGNYLVVGAEAYCSSTDRVFGMCSMVSTIHFYDTTDPAAPVKLPYIIDRSDASAGATAITQDPTDNTFLLMVGRVDSDILDFYRSTKTTLSSDPGFHQIGTWYKESLLVAPGCKSGYDAYQNLNFIRQSDGKLYMVGFARTYKGLGDDIADLFKVEVGADNSITITKVAHKKFRCQSGTCNFQAGAGAYVASETLLLVYGVNWEPKDGQIYVNEFRPALEGKGGSCETYTGNTCEYFGCDSWMGETDCKNGYCFCKPGYCVDYFGGCVKND